MHETGKNMEDISQYHDLLPFTAMFIDLERVKSHFMGSPHGRK